MIYDDATKKIMEKERDILRNELLKLKDCQVRYFWSAITATGAIIGIGIKLGTEDMIALFYMAPLFIIVPCWLIFFDKATTITRIVGYLKVLEYMLISKGESKYHYIGWENALHLFRQQQLKGEKPNM